MKDRFQVVLEKIRKQREAELEEYRLLCSKMPMGISACVEEELIAKRRCVLMLEFPFKTDAVSVNEAWVKKRGQKEASVCQEKSIDSWSEQRLQEQTRGGYLNARNQQNSFNSFISNASIWPRVAVTNYALTGDSTTTSLEKVPVEDFKHHLPANELIKNIHKTTLKESTKRVYCSYAKSLCRFIRDTDNRPVIASKMYRKELEVHDLAAYFHYLEERCLKSGERQYYRDLIEVRLLFYVPLEVPILNQCTLFNINESTQLFEYQDRQYRLPLAFIQLAKSGLSKNDRVLEKSFKQLNTFVSQTATTIGFKMTPSLIRCARDLIADQEGYLQEALPGR